MPSSILKIAIGILLASISANTFSAVIQSLTVPLTFEYEDNPLFSAAANKVSESRVTVTPNYSITANKGSNQFIGGASVRIARSSDQSISQDRNDPSINLGWNHDYEAGQFSVNTLLNEQSTRVSELTDSGQVAGDNTRKTQSISANWLNSLSERSSLTIGGTSTDVKFDGLSIAGLVDFQNDTINTKLAYTLSEKMGSFVQLSFSRFKADDVNNTINDTRSINAGLTWDASEQLNLSGSVGASETASKSDVLSSAKVNGWQGEFNLQYTTLLTSSYLTLSRRQSPGSTGSLNEANAFAVGWNYSLSEKDEFGFDYNWRQNLTLNKTLTTQFSTQYTRQISLLWDFRLSLGHKVIGSNLLKASSNSIMASIIYKLPEF